MFSSLLLFFFPLPSAQAREDLLQRSNETSWLASWPLTKYRRSHCVEPPSKAPISMTRRGKDQSTALSALLAPHHSAECSKKKRDLLACPGGIASAAKVRGAAASQSSEPPPEQ